ncbi:hypothetical protein J6590_026273 [Homalodisca vitripennis]|nr:hypothetical protein J6590_026273 [Homalodisca vitripennis]
MKRKHREVNFYLTQFLTDCANFQAYLFTIGKFKSSECSYGNMVGKRKKDSKLTSTNFHRTSLFGKWSLTHRLRTVSVYLDGELSVCFSSHPLEVVGKAVLRESEVRAGEIYSEYDSPLQQFSDCHRNNKLFIVDSSSTSMTTTTTRFTSDQEQCQHNSLPWTPEKTSTTSTMLCLISPTVTDMTLESTIICAGDFTEPLKIALLADNKQNFDEKLHYNFCEDLEECLSWVERHGNSPEYIVIIIDPKNRSCIEIAEDNIKKLDSTFISGGRLCLVNGACSIKPTDMGVGLGHINVLAQKYSVILINGDVMVPDKCQNLATRISGLASAVCGLNTGIPFIVDIPGYDELFQ